MWQEHGAKQWEKHCGVCGLCSKFLLPLFFFLAASWVACVFYMTKDTIVFLFISNFRRHFNSKQLIMNIELIWHCFTKSGWIMSPEVTPVKLPRNFKYLLFLLKYVRNLLPEGFKSSASNILLDIYDNRSSKVKVKTWRESEVRHTSVFLLWRDFWRSMFSCFLSFGARRIYVKYFFWYCFESNFKFISLINWFSVELVSVQ